ncbi:MAG: hypothetical protein WCG50_10265 [Rhodoferax sp.]|uniref:hypothetical protein n=1 Tax=Rhodoferax sp. TaxID=50421 RepID=UPI003015EAE3
MSPGPGCARSSSLTSLHPPPRRHRLAAVLALGNSTADEHSQRLAGSGRCGIQRSEVKEEAKGRGTRTALSATPS